MKLKFQTLVFDTNTELDTPKRSNDGKHDTVTPSITDFGYPHSNFKNCNANNPRESSNGWLYLV